MTKTVIEERGVRRVVLVDSITEIDAGEAGQVVVSASHGGLSAAYYASQIPLAGCFFNDAGIGKDQAGVAGLERLAALGMPAAAYSHQSARIGEAADAWAGGVLSTVNRPAQRSGLRSGQTVREAARRLLDGTE